MKFVYPIEGKLEKELYKLNREGKSGFYPIGVNNAYHGGVHFEGSYPVVAIAEGTIIAYRYSKKYCEETIGNKTCKYSNCFILIRHQYTSPKGRSLTFYSHYNHLCPWEEFVEEQKKRLPPFFTAPGFKITSNSLNVRSSMDSSKEVDNIIEASKLKKGDEVIASKVDDNWAKKEGLEEYIFYKGYTEAVTISSDPEFDSIISCSIQVNAGTLLGYTGLYENEGALEKNIVHVEVFAGDEAKTFFENKEKEGQNKPKILQITAGAALMAKEKKYSKPETLVKVVLKADTNVVVLDKETDTEWIHVQEKEIIRSVKREWLEYHDDKTKKGDEHYTPKKENLADVSKTFDSLELNVNSKLIYVAKDGEANRKVRYTLSDDEAEKFWVKKASLGEIKTDIITVSQNIPDCYRVNPNTVVFNSGSGKTSEEILLKFDEIETTRDSEKKLWYHIKNSSIDGWICDSDTTNVKKLSAFDWPGFRIEIEEGDTAYDPVIDFKNLSPFFKSIVDAINTDSDKSTISKEELKKAFKDDTISYKLSRLICFHQSEWWSDNGMNYWDSVFKKLDKKRAENLKCRIKNVCWWEEVSQKVKDFLPTPNVYHWHPVAFVENMREMNKEPEWIVIAKGETGQKEISGTKHNDRIVQYHKTTTLPENLYNDETAWCSSFVNWCFKQAGYIGTNSAWAKDWLGWGKLFKKPVYGAVAIVDYGKDNSGKDRGGHVGFVVGKKANGSILILGGNQGKQGQGSVNEKPFGTGSIAGYVLPADYEFVNFDLEIKDSTEEEGSYENTR